MKRQIKLVHWGLTAALAVLLSSCGGGGGGGGSRGATGAPSPTPIPTLAPGENTPTPTTTPLRAVSSRNERTESSDAGSITLRLQEIDIRGGQTTAFSVFLTDAGGHPVVGDQLQIETGVGLQVLSPEGGVGTTRADGTLSGTVRGIFGGTFALTVTDMTDNSPLRGLSVTLTIVVNAPLGLTPTQTGGNQATATPTPLPCADVQTIIVQTDTFNVSGQVGGHPVITAEVFDSNNFPVPQVNVLFDVQPRIAAFDQITQVTDHNGQASTRLTIPANSTVGTLTVSAFACNRTGSVSISVVSGVSTKPVKSVVLQADPSTVGTISGGTVTLTAAVVDADNVPINGIDVLFITSLGKVNPLIDRTKVAGAQGGIATSVLQVPIGAVEQPYTISALAGGIAGSTTIRVVPGRGLPGGINPGVPPGEPAGISLGANPTRIQVSGTGGTDLATVIGRVFDNNGNPLSGVVVHYHVVAAQSAPGAVILAATQRGTPTPAPSTLCAPDDPVALSDNAGFAVIQVHSGQQPGPVTVAACTDTTVNGVPKPLIEQQALVTVTSGPVSRIHLTINNVFVDNNDGSLTTTVSSIVTDAQGNTVEDGTPVFFEVLTRKVCVGGSNDGRVCSSSGDCSGGSCLNDGSDPSLNIAVSSDATTNALPTCDISQFIVQTGIPISPQPGDAITCLKFPAIQQASEVTVRATVGGVFNNLAGQTLTLPGRIRDLEVNVNPSTVRVSNSADALAIVRASVLNASLDGVPNVRVRFSTSIGTIDRSVLTDENGDATATLVIPAGTSSGTATLRVAAGGLQIPNTQVPSLTVTIVNTGGGTTPTPSTGAQPAAIQFVGAAPAVIGVRGSGLPEQSVLTFLVTDGSGAPVPGVQVNFSLARIADERISPLHATTDSQGKVQVTLASGRRALSVQVTAQVDASPAALTVRSTVVTILGGPPSQPNFSLAHQFNNISGRVTFGLTDITTAFVADRFGNPVPPGTAVSFTTKGGAIGNPTTTNSLGQATATLVSQQPVPDNGTVVSLATTVGERPFIDTNGNGVCDDGIDPLLAVPEPFYDANCNGVHDPGEDFVDANGDGQFNLDQSDLNLTPGGPKCSDQILVFEPICTTFSAHTSLILIASSNGQLTAGGSRDYTLIISDNPDPIGNPGVGNPLVGGSRVAVTIDGGRAKALGIGSFALPDAFTNDQIVDGISRFHFTVVDNNPAATQAETDAVVVTVTSEGLPAGGNGSAVVSSLISFAAAPSPTPTGTPLPTSTPQPPAIAPNQAALAGGTGAPPNACNGSTQTFVVTGGNPPFSVFAGGGCVSVNSVPTSGGSFVFTAGNTLGDFTVTVTDAGGKTASAGVRVLGPSTPSPTLTASQTPTPPSTATPTVTNTALAPRSIVFVSAQPGNIGVKGSGLPEQSALAFRVTDALARPIPNALVHFSLLSLGGETIEPIDATSNDNGIVQTILSSGNRATAVRVTATAIGFPSVTTQSTAVNIVGGAPSANRFSMAAQFRNIAGRVTFGLRDVVSVFANDRFGNAVLPGTAVNFQSDGGSLVDITATNPQGVASATLVSDGQVPPNGVVTVLAYTRGEKAFTDLNGNGVPDVGEPVAPLPEPFFDKNGNGTRDPGESFIDVNSDGIWNADQEPVGQFSNEVLVFTNFRVTFSGATLALMDPPSFMIEDGGSAPVTLLLSDDLNNPLVAGTKVDIAITPGVKLRGIPPTFTLGDTETLAHFADGVNRFRFFIDDEKPGDGDVPQQVAVTVTITSPPSNTAPGGNGNATVFSNGVLLPRPTPTPIPVTNTPTPVGGTPGTPIGPTPTPPQPVGAIQFVLFPQPTQIGVRQSGRPEQSILTFKVTDPNANPLAGVKVKFKLTGDGDETLNPMEVISDGFGFARTTVTSGTRAGTITVIASADANGDGIPDLFAQSTAVAVVGGPPVSNRVSLATQKRNFPGRARLGQSVEITALLNDRFGNAVPEGTAVTFITNGGAILGQIPTGPDGAATALLTAEEPFTSTGISTVMAYTRGEEAFLDNNGNGVFDAGIDTISGDNSLEPFIDFRPLPGLDASCTVAPPSPRCNNAFDPNKPFEVFVDTGAKDGIWDTQGTSGVWDNNILVFGTVSVTMSGPLGTPVVTPNSATIAPGGTKDFTLVVGDDLGNPLALGAHITVKVGNTIVFEINTGGEQSFNQPVDGLTQFHFTVTNMTVGGGGSVQNAMIVSVESDNGNGSFNVGTVTFQ